MSLGKGTAFALAGAALGAVIWAGLGIALDMRLWILAPIIGGAAGYGMMRGTAMKGGVPAGALTAIIAVAAIFVTRYAVARYEVGQYLSDNPDLALESLAAQVADEWTEEDDDIQTYDDETGDYTQEVYEEASDRWDAMTSTERSQLLASINADNEATAAVLTPIALIFDFGIFGIVCTALTAGAAFKTASTTLEQALIEKGHANAADAGMLAAKLRAEDAAKRNGGFEPHMTTINEPEPSPAVTPQPSLAENAGIFGQLAKREAEAPKPLGKGILGRTIDPDGEQREAA